MFNYALGEVLKNQRRSWKESVESEQTNSIENGQADNLVYPNTMQPVVVEAAFERTGNIDGDAIRRLGKTENITRREIMTAVALSIPYALRNSKDISDMRQWLESGGKLKYAVYSLVKGDDNLSHSKGFDIRYPDGEPNSSYITGTVSDLANLIELSATPDKKIKQVASAAGREVRGIAALMYKKIHETTRQQIADKVGQPADVHAMRVAACVWLNALTLHSKLAKAHPNDIVSLSKCKTYRETIDAWNSILEIDYRSVFFPALKSLSLLSEYSDLVRDIIDRLKIQVELNNELYLGNVADISSDMFPELATDRQVTAAFYTRIEAAELLAGMAFNLIPQEKNNLKIADFACGTGALLKAAYRQVRRRAELDKNINLQGLHKNYMENCLHGVDIQPIAAHLTVAGLAGMCPDSKYKHSNIICADIRDGKTGSLDLLKSEALHDLFGESKTTATDGDTHDFRPADNTFDLCIMNPPYSRPHGNRSKGKIFGVKGMRADNRKQSVKATYNYLSGTFANMKAGMASAFCLLADKKLRKGGILAAVLPLSAAGQYSWRPFRAHILHNYSDVIVVGGCNFSADTGMGEMLICARKGGKSTNKITVINLRQLPRDFVEAYEMTRALKNMPESGELKIGNYVFGVCIKSSPQNTDPWGAIGVHSVDMATIAERLIVGELHKVGLVEKFKIGITMKPLNKHLVVGPSHDHIGHPSTGDGRGAFAFRELSRGDRANLSLWVANHKTQTCLICKPTHRGDVVKGKQELAKTMLEKQSVLFMSKGLRMTSQKLASAITEEPYMGGRAWATLIVSNNEVVNAYCLWFNSILGLICRWQCSGRQHPGRSQMQLGDIGEMPCPDFSGESVAAKRAVKIANAQFPQLAELVLSPCSMAWHDENRKKIDSVVLKMLGIDKNISENEMQMLREEWCREPLVHGNNKVIVKALQADELL